MPSRRRLGAAFAALVASAGLAVPTARADESAPPTPPVVSSVLTGSQDSTVPEGTPPIGVLTLHAVRRVPQATIIYFSIGFTADAPQFRFRSLSGYLGLGHQFTTGALSAASPITTEGAIIDHAHKTLYTALVDKHGDCLLCLDHDLVWAAAGDNDRALTAYLGLPALPAGVTTVDVAIGNRIFPNVPVGDGLLEPGLEVHAGGAAPLLGQGWPKIDTSRAGQAYSPATMSTHALVQTTTSGNVSERTRPTRTDFDVPTKVLFDKDKAVVKPAGVTALRQLATKLKDSGATHLQVTGYTDNLGTEQHGLELSRRRADAVAAALKPLLASGVTMTTAGLGEKDPIASNATEAGREQNRRVTVTVKEG